MRLLKVLVSAVLLISMLTSTALATDTITTSTEAVPIEYSMMSDGEQPTPQEIAYAEQMGLEIIGKITDPLTIQQLVDSGEEQLGPNGELPKAIITYKTKTPDLLPPESSTQSASSGIVIVKEHGADVWHSEEYDEYDIQGPCNYTTTYTKTSSVNWNTSFTGSVSVGGTVYGIADIEAALELSIGYDLDEEITKSATYSVNIPDGEKWIIRVWINYRRYDWTAKVGSVEIADGQVTYPNGLIIRHTEYDM